MNSLPRKAWVVSGTLGAVALAGSVVAGGSAAADGTSTTRTVSTSDSILTTSQSRRAGAGAAPAETVLSVGDIRLDLLERRLTVTGREHDLTEREFHLLEALMRHPGQVLGVPTSPLTVPAPSPARGVSS